MTLEPFDAAKTAEIEIVIRFTAMDVSLKIPGGGVKVTNPSFAPGAAPIPSGLLFGLEDKPPDTPANYPYTLFSESLRQHVIALTMGAQQRAIPTFQVRR